MADLIYAHCAMRAARRPSIAGQWPRVPGGDAPRALAVGHGLWIIVSTVSGSEYDEGRLAGRLADAEWLAQCGVAHHDVIVRAARGRAVAPFRLLTLYRSDARVAEEVDRRRATIEEALDCVGGRREWGIRIALSRPRARTHTRRPSRTSYVVARGARNHAVASTSVARAARAFLKEVGRYADRLVARESTAPHLLYHGALLVSRAREHDLTVAVRQWARRLIPIGCRVSLTGPWPPYSFASLEDQRARRGA